MRYGLDAAHLDQTLPESAIRVRRVPKEGEAPNDLSLHSAPAGTVQYDATVAGLEPDTTYYYAIGNGAATLAGGDSEHHFRTHPEPGPAKPIRIWVVGDSGTGDARQAAVYQAMRDHVAKEKHPLDLYVHVGDMAYPSGTDEEFQRTFFDVYQPTLRNTVCWASMGNHEGHTSKGLLGVGPYYDAYICPKRGEAGGLPSASEAFYAFDYANVHFICLDSHDLDRAPTGVMVNRGGDNRDLFSIVKQGSVVPQIVKSPRTLPLYSVAIDKPKVNKSEMTPFPKNSVELIKPNSEWDYLAGSHPPEKWTALGFIPNDAGGWKSGTVGLGYGDSDDVTELKDDGDCST